MIYPETHSQSAFFVKLMRRAVSWLRKEKKNGSGSKAKPATEGKMDEKSRGIDQDG